MVWFRRLTLILPFGGLFIAGYLSYMHLMGFDVACGVQSGCAEVELYVQQHWGNFPVAYLGLVAYGVLIALGIMGLMGHKTVSSGLLVSGIGTLTSVILVCLSLFVIKSTCLWCLGSAAVMTLTFICYLILNSNVADGIKAHGIDYGFVGIGAIGALAGLFFMISNAPNRPEDHLAGPIEKYIRPNPKMYGDANAPITIIEFFDFQCAHCQAAFFENKNLIDRSKGKARLIMMHFPFMGTSGHELSAPASVISEMCREKGKFYEFTNDVFMIPHKDLKFDDLVRIGVKYGLDGKTIQKRLKNDNDPAYKELEGDLKIVNDLGVGETPTYLVSHKGDKTVDVYRVSTFFRGVTGVRYGLPKD